MPKLTLSQFFHNLHLVNFDIFGLLHQIRFIVLLLLHHFVDRLTIHHGFTDTAAKSFDYFVSSCPGNFAILFHLDIKLELAVMLF